MAGYYVPSSFSSNYVNNKKDEDGSYTADKAINSAGIDAQRNLNQLNKQYNNTINNAYAGNLLANRGLRASTLGSGFKQAYTDRLQQATNDDINKVNLSVADTKRSIFDSLGANINQVATIQQQEIDNMRRMASSLEQYHEYTKSLTDTSQPSAGAFKGDEYSQALQSLGNATPALGVSYAESQGFKLGDEYTFEDNYDKLLGTQKGVIGKYTDVDGKAGLAWEDWFRQNSGNSAKDTAWLDWVYTTGATQYKDFIKNGVNKIY